MIRLLAFLLSVIHIVKSLNDCTKIDNITVKVITAAFKDMLDAKTGIKTEMTNEYTIKLNDTTITIENNDAYYFSQTLEPEKDAAATGASILDQFAMSGFSCDDKNLKVCDLFISMNKLLLKTSPHTFRCFKVVDINCETKALTFVSVLHNNIMSKIFKSNSLFDFVLFYESLLRMTKKILDNNSLMVHDKDQFRGIKIDRYKDGQMVPFIKYWGYYYDPSTFRMLAFPRFMNVAMTPEKMDEAKKFVEALKAKPKTNEDDEKEPEKLQKENDAEIDKKRNGPLPLHLNPAMKAETLIAKTLLLLKEVQYGTRKCKYITSLMKVTKIPSGLTQEEQDIHNSAISTQNFSYREMTNEIDTSQNKIPVFRRIALIMTIVAKIYCLSFNKSDIVVFDDKLLTNLIKSMSEASAGDTNLEGPLKKNFYEYFINRKPATNALFTLPEINKIVNQIRLGQIKADQVPDYLIMFKAQLNALYNDYQGRSKPKGPDDDEIVNTAWMAIVTNIYDEVKLSGQDTAGPLKALLLQMDNLDNSLRRRNVIDDEIKDENKEISNGSGKVEERF